MTNEKWIKLGATLNKNDRFTAFLCQVTLLMDIGLRNWLNNEHLLLNWTEELLYYILSPEILYPADGYCVYLVGISQTIALALNALHLHRKSEWFWHEISRKLLAPPLSIVCCVVCLGVRLSSHRDGFTLFKYSFTTCSDYFARALSTWNIISTVGVSSQ